MPWKYAPDEDPKRKHHWSNDYAGFKKVGNSLVGKCPNNLSLAKCEQLINVGVGWSPDRWNKKYPKRIYTIHEGVVYRATPNVGGVSYHGFPELLDQFPREMADRVIALADQLGFGPEVRTWLNEL
jgi:hypothetical protein